MAYRPSGFGLSAELASKKDAKYDVNFTEELLVWVTNVFAHAGVKDDSIKFDAAEIAENSTRVHELLKNGSVLCKLMNCLEGGSVKKINESKMAFKQMENISKFLSACESYGCNKMDLFQTVDLYEGQNIPQVMQGVAALARKCQTKGYDGPSFGPNESVKNKREFSEDQLRAGQGIIGLQAGSNKGASQAGQSFGKTRMILD